LGPQPGPPNNPPPCVASSRVAMVWTLDARTALLDLDGRERDRYWTWTDQLSIPPTPTHRRPPPTAHHYTRYAPLPFPGSTRQGNSRPGAAHRTGPWRGAPHRALAPPLLPACLLGAAGPVRVRLLIVPPVLRRRDVTNDSSRSNRTLSILHRDAPVRGR
jgi:hypothetical protein